MNRSRTTGVLTFHRCINYGSYWQARSLVAGLRARGHDAVLLDHHSRRVARAEWQCALQPVLPASSPPRDRLLYGIKALRFMTAIASLPRSARFSLEKPAGMHDYEMVVVGSDEVWSLRHPWYGGSRLFYGDEVRTQRLVSYAASFGSHTMWEGLERPWAERLRRFDAISVRDENSWWMIRNALGVEPVIVLDPCLQFSVPLEGRWRGPTGPFVAVYGHSFSPAFARHVSRWAKSRGLPLVSIGYRNEWADRHWITAAPQDFAHFMARAEAVVTNFFHGCVFALRNARPFVCESSPYRSIKVHNLMTGVGGERHLVTNAAPAATYEDLLAEPLSQEILRRIDQLRGTSEEYLRGPLGAERDSAADSVRGQDPRVVGA